MNAAPMIERCFRYQQTALVLPSDPRPITGVAVGGRPDELPPQGPVVPEAQEPVAW